MSVFEPVSFEFQKVGKFIKSSKQRFTWKIFLDSLDYTIVMFYSKLSTKVKILLNGEIVLCTKATEQQIYRFQIRYRKLAVVKLGDLFDLRFENLSVSAILSGKQKIKKHFSVDGEQKVQLRRSLPCSIVGEVPAINFRRTAKDVDLLGIRPNNPFDTMEEDDQPVFYKSSSSISENRVPWPTEQFFNASRRRY